MAKKCRTIAAGQFKQSCLAVLDEVATGHTEVVITKRGRPMARLVAIETDEQREQRILARLRGKGRALVDDDALIEPSSKLADWAALDDNV